MRIKAISTILLGLGLAGGASFLATDLGRDDAGAAQATEPEMIEVVVARSEITFGQQIERRMLGLQEWPAQSVPAGVFVDMDALVASEGSEPRRALGRIFPGELMLGAKVSAPGERVTLVQKLREGHRAMAIEVDAGTAVGGFVTPGDDVDILMTQGGGEELRAVTVLRNIRVVGVDQTAEEASDQPSIARTITVEVTPEQAQRLALARRAGALSLSLRTYGALDEDEIGETNIDDLFATPEPEAVEVQRKRITVRRGTEVEEVTLR